MDVQLEKRNVLPEKQFTIMLLFLLFNFLNANCQNKNDIQPDKKQADSLFQYSKEEMKKGNYALALLPLKKSLVIYKELKNNRSIADCLNQMASIHFYQSDFKSALNYFEQSKSHFEIINYKKGIASATNNMGAVYYYLGNYPRAIENYKKALQVHEKLENKVQVAGTTQNIGNIYLELEDFKNAKKHFKLAQKAYQKTEDRAALALVLSSLGKLFLKEKNYDSALHYFTSSLSLVNKEADKQTHAEIVYNLGKLYEALEDHTQSQQLFKQSLYIAREAKSILRESAALIALGRVYHQIDQPKYAIENCEAGLELAKKINSISIQEEACKCLYDAYKSSNNIKRALLYHEQIYLLKDSLNLKQASDKILNMKFEREMLLDSITHVEKERVAEIAHQKIVEKKEKQRNVFIVAGVFALFIAAGIFSRLNFVKKSKAILQVEKDRSEHLLHNILPEEVAQELKEKGCVDAKDFDTASILFTDFQSFTEKASRLTPQELVEEINVHFKAFDQIVEDYQIEKIKTIGDAYMAAGGLPKPDVKAVKNTILAALDMQAFVLKRKQKNAVLNKPYFEMRIGVHVGPIVAGIVGVKKFQYDVWGDTVNIASRMESNGGIGKVNISSHTHSLIQEDKDLAFEYRGKISVKGKGELDMFFVSKAIKKNHSNKKKEPIASVYS